MGLVILLSGAVAVFSGVLPVGDRGGVDVRTSPSTSPRVPGTARTTVPPVSEQTTSVAFPSATATTVAVDRTLPTPTTVPASATTPVPTTAPEPTPTVTTSPDTTTTTEPVVTPPTYFVSVTQGARSCGFQPSAATVVAGSTVEFGNDTDDSVVISIVSPVGADTTITFDAGLTSAPYPFTVPGTYDLTCTRRGDIASGQMTIVATRV